MNFIVKGILKSGNKWEPFTKKIATLSKKQASEKTFSLIGSEHRLKRNQIKINSIEEAK